MARSQSDRLFTTMVDAPTTTITIYRHSGTPTLNRYLDCRRQGSIDRVTRPQAFGTLV